MLTQSEPPPNEVDDPRDEDYPSSKDKGTVTCDLDQGRSLQIGKELESDIRSKLIELLTYNADEFSWKAEDVTGVDKDVICHNLAMNENLRPVRQKRRNFSTEKSEAIAQEVTKLLRLSHIRPVKYPVWVANSVLGKKKNGKWRICVDFIDLNRACPKYAFPLPKIDHLVDNS